MFLLKFTATFISHREKVIGTNEVVNKRLRASLQKLALNPHHSSLKTHKANTKNYGEKWSSWTTGDIRIIWDYDTENRLVIILLDIGKHSGTHKVYK